MSSRISHGGKRKIGRYKIKCEIYKREHRREKNKLRKLRKIFRYHPNNKLMYNKIKELELII